MPMIISGVHDAVEDLQRLARNAGNLTDAFGDIFDELEDESRDTFRFRGSNLGIPWQPLAASTTAQKGKRGKVSPLVKSGGLERSLTLPTAVGAIRQARKHSFTFGSRHPLAHLHQDGTNGGRLPARTLLTVTPEIAAMVKRKVQDHLLDGVN